MYEISTTVEPAQLVRALEAAVIALMVIQNITGEPVDSERMDFAEAIRVIEAFTEEI